MTSKATNTTAARSTPVGDTSLFILGGSSSGNIRDDWCPQVNFFANSEDAETWVAANHLDGDIVPIAAIAPGATAMWRPVVEPNEPHNS